MSKVTEINSALEELARPIPSDEDLDIVEIVKTATRPSNEVQRALNLVQTKVWRLSPFKELNVGQNILSDGTRNDPRCKYC
jgi:hypothetical protein